MNRKHKKISSTYQKKLVAMVLSGVMTFGIGNLASAEDSVRPSNPSSGNTATLRDKTYTLNDETVSHNGTFDEFDGGYNTSGDASHNHVTVYGGNVTTFLNGGYSSIIGDASYNTLTIYDGTFGRWVEGGWAETGNANYNTVNIHGGTFNNTIVDGGYTVTGNTNYNTVNIYDGNFTSSSSNAGIYGGFIEGNGNAVGNVINISGGTISGKIVGGYVSGTGEVANNVINIYGNPDLSNATISAYAATDSSNITSYGNSINIYTKNITAKNIGGFESLNFYLPSDTQNGDTILTLTDGSSTSARIGEEILYASAGSGGTDLSNTQINVSTSGAVNLQTGDTVTLVRNDNGLLTSDVSNSGTITQGVSVNYDLNLARSADGNSYVATIGERSSELLPQTEAFNSAPIDSVSLLDSGTDRIIEWLPPEEVEMMNNENGKNSMPSTGFDPFGGIGGSVLKLNSGNGSRLENRNGGMNVGMARALKNRHGYLVFGPITDYGQDYFESTLEDGTRGHGQSKYFSAGIIARQMNTGGMYYEGSLRYGRVQTHFSSDNFLVNNIPTHVDYNASTPCYSGHVRVGWRDKVSPNTILDVYGIYSYNKIKGFHTTVSTGEIYNFSSTDSGRIRIGARLTRNIRDLQRLYSGVAFIHEFTGETRGEYLGMETRKSGLKGSSGLVELGWQIKPSKNSAVMLDTSVTAWFGHQKGATFQMKFKREF